MLPKPRRQSQSPQTERLRGIINFANGASRQRQHDRAEKLFREALRERPSDAYLLSRLADSVRGQRRLDEAEKISRQAISKNPTSWYAFFVLSSILFGAGRSADALVAAREVIRLDPGRAFGYVVAGFALCELERPKEALEFAERALGLSNNTGVSYASCLHVRALAFAQLRQTKKAVAAVNAFLQAYPNSFDAHVNAGWVYWSLGSKFNAQAMKHVRAAMAIRPAHEEGHALMGLVLIRQNDLPGAKRHLEEALRIRPTFPRARAALDSLQSTRKAQPLA